MGWLVGERMSVNALSDWVQSEHRWRGFSSTAAGVGRRLLNVYTGGGGQGPRESHILDSGADWVTGVAGGASLLYS